MLTTFSLPPTPQPCTPVSQGCHNYFHTIHSLARNRVSTEMTHGIKPKLERANSVKAKEEALTLSYRQTLDPGKIGFKISLRIDSMVSQVLSSNAKTVVLRDAAAAKSLQSCLTLRPHRRLPPGSPVPGIFQARTLEWVAISFSNAWKWKVKSEKWSRSVVSDASRPHGLQPTRLLHPWDFPGKSTGVGCHCL